MLLQALNLSVHVCGLCGVPWTGAGRLGARFWAARQAHDCFLGQYPDWLRQHNAPLQPASQAVSKSGYIGKGVDGKCRKRARPRVGHLTYTTIYVCLAKTDLLRASRRMLCIRTLQQQLLLQVRSVELRLMKNLHTFWSQIKIIKRDSKVLNRTSEVPAPSTPESRR